MILVNSYILQQSNLSVPFPQGTKHYDTINKTELCLYMVISINK